MTSSPAPGDPPSIKRERESSPSPDSIKRRKLELAEKLATMEPGLLEARYKVVYQNADEMALNRVNTEENLEDARLALNSAKETVDAAERAHANATEKFHDADNRLENWDEVKKLRRWMTRQIEDMRDVKTWEIALNRVQRAFEVAQRRVECIEKVIDRTLDILDVKDLEFVVGDEDYPV
ncbi:uncharacterized protein FIESC28_08059 [Fusarium coffeatum]|uniref:Uncharacterized protein n=1 Tax=Fusarium coffeatum TaxID=231269 RepID=A0A366RA01_9HYPO|nr:uncharacterized protein FIESC28_08059 [Fusarium coffeatum]RBR13722.1 hypothetical protein FIESC28_08059 [Fusarium coffeatum]